ncbi:hypothetical protein [Bizionia myxarmorum]|uniref:PH domain-containing protein n=1 Tax=Bizionia myxarmorum TaxID=291186 RepID=A0A5D0R4N6_9FLAO|nr:hypothetical protein [Bizionia myxarmorum]TYB75846.1 hypothetical protein ES674_13565 [Bizionia myxarmorum]
MKIRFKKKTLYVKLMLGIIWTGLGVFLILEDDASKWFDYGYLVLGIAYLGIYSFDLTYQYLTIENGTIRKNGLHGFGKKIKLNDINWIKKYAGEYTLISATKQLKINTEILDEKSLQDLNSVLEKLNLPSDKTPFQPSNLV